MRFLKAFLVILAVVSTADAQIFKRGKTTYSCQNGQCRPVDNPLAEAIKLPPANIGDPDFPTGVVPDQLTQGYKINGKEVSRADVIGKIEQNIPEFDKKWRAVVVGTTDARKVALDKIGSKDSVVVNAYDPAHFYAKDFRTLVTLMRPNGEVVAEAANPDEIAKVMKFTEVGPNDPQPAPPPAPPDQPKPAPTPTPDTPWYLNWIHGICAACGGLLVYLMRYAPSVLAYFKANPDVEAQLKTLLDAKLKELSDANHLVAPTPSVPMTATSGWK